MIVPKEQVEAWVNTDPTRDDLLIVAGALGQVVHGTNDQVKAALAGHLTGLAAGTQVEFPFAGMPVPAPGPAPAPAPARPSVIGKAIGELKQEAKEGWKIAWDAVWNLKIK